MADNRKYYYLKLKENLFDSDSIVLLEDMKDGILYSNILLKLYLKSLKNGGKLQLDEHIPYTAQMIATLTRHQIGTVERALEIFRQLGLVEQLDSGAFYMTDIELMIGQSSTEAERKRAARLENKALLPPRTKGGHLSDIRPPEIEIELEKEIEIEKEREGETGHAATLAVCLARLGVRPLSISARISAVISIIRFHPPLRCNPGFERAGTLSWRPRWPSAGWWRHGSDTACR